MTTEIPQDPMMLMSYINLKLRDEYPTLDELCEDLGIEKKKLCAKMASIGCVYSPKYNKFW